MDDTAKYLTDTDKSNSEFGPHVEKSIISLAFDHPDLFMSVGRFMEPAYFEAPEAKYVISIILNNLEKHEVVPTRGLIRDFVLNHLTEDDPYQLVLELIDRKSNPREVPIIKEQMIDWAKKRAYGLIYSDEAMLAYQNNDFDAIEKIIKDAQKITDMQVEGIWLLDNFDMLFNPATIEHRTTGFGKLDAVLNDGGPSPKEVVCWTAGTNVGKCHSLESKIIERNLSNIYNIELENGTTIKIAGFRKVQTARGLIKVCNLTDGDDIIEIPPSDHGDLKLSDVQFQS